MNGQESVCTQSCDTEKRSKRKEISRDEERKRRGLINRTIQFYCSMLTVSEDVQCIMAVPLNQRQDQKQSGSEVIFSKVVATMKFFLSRGLL